MMHLEVAILLCRDVLVLCKVGHPERLMALNNLANSPSTRYKQFGAMGATVFGNH